MGGVALFGLGALGGVLAARLVSAGQALAVFDPNPDALAAHRAACGADTIALDQADVRISCVTDEAADEALILGAGGWVATARAGTLVIDHTTTSPGFARRAAMALAERGAGYVDAPLSGGVGGARAGRLLAMLGGAGADCERAGAVLGAYCARQERFGDAGSGQAAKLANQLCIAGTLAGLDAAAGFARAVGLDVAQVFGALAAGSAHSAQMDQHAALLARADAHFGARFAWIARDLELARHAVGGAGSAGALAGWVIGRLNEAAA